jgi:hypothetical protein
VITAQFAILHHLNEYIASDHVNDLIFLAKTQFFGESRENHPNEEDEELPDFHI